MFFNQQRWASRWLLAGCAGLAATFAPSVAFAGEKVFTVEGDVVVTLQAAAAATGGGEAGAAGGAATGGAAVAAGAGVPVTGDGVLWLMPIVALVGLCAVAALLGSRKAAAGARGAHSSKRGLFSVLLACTLGTALAFGPFGAGAARAAEVDGVTCAGQVVVSEKGEVLSAGFTVSNGGDQAIFVKDITAPVQLEGWSAAAPEAAIEVGGKYEGSWSSQPLSSDLLQELKANNGQLTLRMSADVAVTAYTVSFDTCGVDYTVDDQVVVENGVATAPTADDCEDYELIDWYTDKDYTQAFDFSTPICADTTLYAKWAVKGYWLAAAGAADPTANVVKTMSEVEADVAAIKAGDANVIAEYNKYLADDSVHLYARWNGSTVDETGEEMAANKYVEFRVIQVGDHDGEGCGLTFQATHLLPQGHSMNSKATTTGGWAASELRLSMQPGGAIYQNFDAAFTSKILAVSKKGAKGDLSDELQSSQDKFWLLSYSEITGVGLKKYAAYEGSQYKYWENTGIAYDGKYDFMAIGSRANYYPADLSQGALRWWYRSPMLADGWSGAFGCARCTRTSGYVVSGNEADQVNGVCLAFCL